MPRVITPLNFDWLFQRKGETKKETVHIPHSNTDIPFHYFDEEIYQFESIYTKTFSIDIVDQHQYFLQFDGVLHKAEVYLNDQLVGVNRNGYSSFEFDITQYIKTHNELRVEVDSRETLNQPPFGQTIDYLTYGGIHREVYLVQKPIKHIKDVTIKQSNLLTLPRLEFNVSVTNGEKIQINISDDQEIYSKVFHVNQEILIETPLQLWSPSHPKLYTISITLDQEDEYIFKTGFKEGIFTNEGFFLNGEKLKITGFNRHSIYPYVGYAMPKQAQIEDADLLKTLGNAVRTSHYPQSKHFLNRCDEIGLLVFTEAPGWQFVGDNEWQQHYINGVVSMVKENKHHPSIILWGTRVNESGDFHDLYQKSNQLVKDLDERQTGGVRCFSFSEFLEDVYTYNDFFHNGSNNYLKDKDEIFNGELPYLITEFNGHMFPTKSYDHSDKRLEHALRYAGVLNQIQEDDSIAGSFGWNFADYYTHNEFGSGDHICHHGVFDLFRLPKEAAFVYQSQESKNPFLELLNNSFIGDYNVGYINEFVIASNCDYVDLYQNDRYVRRFYPSNDKYPHLKHPLYHINDLFGEIKKDLSYSEEELSELIDLGKMIASRGGIDKLTKEDNLDPNKTHEAWQLYGKYVANWGSKAFTYHLKGNYKGINIDKTFGPYMNKNYNIAVSKEEIIIDETYDVSKISITATDEFGNFMPYCFDSFKVSVSGEGELIGDSFISLIGGKRSFWIKGIKEGNAQIMIENDNFQHKLKIKITKI